jgi:maltooligosyltrehalose trehalohydrolase
MEVAVENRVNRRLPIGAEPVSGGTHFRVWAPRRKSVEVVLEGNGPNPPSPFPAGEGGPDESGSPPSSGEGLGERAVPLTPESDGYFSGFLPGVGAGARYRYRLDGGPSFPDPASRRQPAGPHGPSEVVDPSTFAWTDAGWPGTRLAGLVISELHVGTFTPAGTFAAAADRLPLLVDLGVTTSRITPSPTAWARSTRRRRSSGEP